MDHDGEPIAPGLAADPVQVSITKAPFPDERPVAVNRTSRIARASRIVLSHPLSAFGTLLLAVFVAVLFIYPTVMVVYGAFRTSAPGFPGGWSTEAFVDAYTSTATYVLLLHSVIYAVCVTVCSMALAVFFAWLVTQTNIPGRRLVTPIMVLIVGLPFMFFALSWQMLGNSQVGLLNQVIRLIIPVHQGPINIRSWVGIIFVSTLKVTAINYMLMLGAFRSLDTSMREASLMAGFGRLYTLFRIELPILAPLLLSLSLLGFVAGLESFDIPLLLGSPVGIQVFSTQIYSFLSASFPPGYAPAAALSILLLLIMGTLAVFMWRFLSRRDFTTIGGKGTHHDVVKIGRWRYLGTATIVLYALLALAFPLVQLVLGSLLPTFGVVTGHLTLEHYREVLSDPQVTEAFRNTAIIAVVGGLVAVTFAAVAAYLIQRTRSRARWLLEGATWLPWALPGVVLGLGMLWAYLSVPGLKRLYGSVWLIMLALIVVATPVTVRLANAAIAQVHAQLEEAARVHGASRPRAVLGVVLRQILPSLLAAWLVSGVTMAGTLSVPVMLSGPDSMTVPVVVLNLMDNGKSSQAAAVFTLMIAAIGLGLAVIGLLRWSGARVLRRSKEPADTGGASALPPVVAHRADAKSLLVSPRHVTGQEEPQHG
ncbi:MAG TPA: iron ABC transporter permease [Trebonia sp.]|jgi:iron(III) transport system permease protein|nr:iron ABC transporter permease [Trebonia sp.]